VAVLSIADISQYITDAKYFQNGKSLIIDMIRRRVFKEVILLEIAVHTTDR